MQPREDYTTILRICQLYSFNVFDKTGNVPHRGRRPGVSDVEVLALVLLQEKLEIGSELRFFAWLLRNMPRMARAIGSRRNFNARKRRLSSQLEQVRRNVVAVLNARFETDVFVVDSMPPEACRYARANRSKIFKDREMGQPAFGYCAAQQQRYYGHKLHCVCSRWGVIQVYDLSAANHHDIKYLHDIIDQFRNCVLIGDKGYKSNPMRLELFEYAGIELAVPCRKNELLQYSMPSDYAPIRKRIETIFSQLVDQMHIRRNYAKSLDGLAMRVIAKISLYTIKQLINSENNKPLCQVRYAFSAA